MPQTLLDIFPNFQDMLDVEPEVLAGAIMELLPTFQQNQLVSVGNVAHHLFPPAGPSYPPLQQTKIHLAIAEALSWLVTQGLLVQHPNQGIGMLARTRRGATVSTGADVRTFAKGRLLPIGLLQPVLKEKVWPLYLRGDHDVAVFQAFKIVEVAVRKAANESGANFPDDLVGVKLMQAAFNVDSGALRDASSVSGERQAEMFLFAGAIGHAKNPVSHRDPLNSAEDAARLIVFSSHLLEILQERSR